MNKSQDLYQTTRIRLTKWKDTKQKYISDKEIIEELAIEIQQYREQIEKLNKTIRNLMKEDKALTDVATIITTTHYVGGEVITKEELLELEDKDKFNVLINIVNGKVKLNETSYKTREQLVNETGQSDREVRRQISELKKERVVICSSNTKGYRLAKEINTTSKIELQKEIDLVKHCIAEIQSKERVHNKQLEEYTEYLQLAEKRLNKHD